MKRLWARGSNSALSFPTLCRTSRTALRRLFVIGEDFIGDDSVAMILGDNIFYGNGLGHLLRQAAINPGRATIFGYYVDDPSAFGVVEFNAKGEPTSIEEKPKEPKSNYAVTGLYFFYDNRVVEFAKALQPSARGEYEITDINRKYLELGDLDVRFLGRGFAWLDTGTVDALMDAAHFIRTVEKLQGIKICSPEEIAYNKRWITKKALISSAEKYGKSTYGQHLRRVAEGKILYENAPGKRARRWGSDDDDPMIHALD